MANSSRMLIAPVCLLLLLHFADIILGHFGAGGPPGGWGGPPPGGPPQGGWGGPPPGGPPGGWGAPPPQKGGSSEGVWKLPKGGIDLGDIGKGMFDWFGGKGGKPPNQEDAKKMGITKPPPPASLPPACPFSSLIKTPPVSPVWQQCASTPPPSLQNIDKSKCTCELLPSCVDSLCKMDVNKLALGVKVTPDKPNPTLLDSCNAKYKGKPDLDKPPVKVLSNCVGQTDLVGLKTCHDSLQSGQVQNVKDLVLNLKQNSPGNYVVLSNLIVGLQADYNGTVNCLGDKTANMVNTFIANLKAGLDVNVAYQNCMATPDKGSIVDLFGAINQTYPKLADTLSLGPPPAATTPAPSGVFPLPWAAPPPTPSPAPSSMPPCLQPILVDLQNKCKNESDMKDLLGQLNLDCDANVQSVCQKTKEKCPDPLAKMLVQVQPSDLDGLSVFVNAILSGSITTGDQFTSQLQSQCPGLFNFAVSVTANIKLALNVFWSALQDPQLQLMTKLEQPVSNTCLQIKDKVQSNSQPLKDAVKKSVPGAQPLMDTNLNVSDCGLSLGNAINAKIPDPTACQNVLNALQPNPTALDSLFVKIQGSFSAKLKILLGKLQGTDVDGLSLVLSDAAANKFSTWDQFTAELKTKCPGFMELVLMFWNVLKVFFNELDSTLLDLLKQIGQLLLDLLNSLIQILLQANPDDIGKILDAIIKAMPSSEPIVNGIKMYINIQIKITVNGSVSPPPLPSPPPPTLPPPPPTLPPPPPTTTEFVCPAEGAWGPWQPTGQCSDTCGNCGTLIQQRECQGVASCPCLGPKTQVVRCNPSPCAYPRRSCCVGTAQTGCKG